MAGTRKEKTGETSAVTFVRLANSRGSKAVASIRNMQNLANYEHSPVQTRKITETLAREIAALETALNAPKGKKAVSLFEL